MAETSRLLHLARHNVRSVRRTAGLFPRAEATLDMSDRFKTHSMRGLRGKRRAQAAGTEKDELLVRGKYRLVIRALRIDPEFQHAARAMKGARDAAVAMQFAYIADIDENDVIAAGELHSLFDRQRLDFALSRLAQGLVSDGDGLGRNRDVDGAAFDQLRIGGLVDCLLYTSPSPRDS